MTTSTAVHSNSATAPIQVPYIRDQIHPCFDELNAAFVEDGAMLSMFTVNSNELNIVASNVDAKMVETVESAPMFASVAVTKSNGICLMVNFMGPDELYFDLPMNVHVYPEHLRDVSMSFDENSRVGLPIFLTCRTTKKIRAIRFVTLPLQCSQRLLTAAKLQLDSCPSQVAREIDQVFSFSPVVLRQNNPLEACGV